MAIWQRQGGLEGLVHHSDRAANTSLSATPSGWPRPARSSRSVPAATPMATPWPRRSSGCTRLSWSAGAVLGGPGRGRVRHLGVGRLVQPPPAPGAHRACPTGRVEAAYHQREDPSRTTGLKDPSLR
jgi:hypothetical protein